MAEEVVVARALAVGFAPNNFEIISRSSNVVVPRGDAAAKKVVR